MVEHTIRQVVMIPTSQQETKLEIDALHMLSEWSREWNKGNAPEFSVSKELDKENPVWTKIIATFRPTDKELKNYEEWEEKTIKRSIA